MTGPSDEQDDDHNSLPPEGDELRSASATRKTKSEAEPDPTLSAFFGDKAVRPAAFFSAIRKAKVTHFKSSDEIRAWDIMSAEDPFGQRLWTLLSQSNLPEAVDRWVWPTVQRRLANVVGEKFDPLNQTSLETLDAICGFVAAPTSEAEREMDISHWTRIGILWLMKRRSVDAWQVVNQLNLRLFSASSEAKKFASKAIERGRSSELKLAVAMAALARGIVEASKRDLDAEQRTTLNLRAQLSRAVEEQANLGTKLLEVEHLVSVKLVEIESIKAELEAEKQHSGHDLTEVRGSQQALLRERIRPLLTDAIDALEIDPAAPAVALRRLQNIIEIIEKA